MKKAKNTDTTKKTKRDYIDFNRITLTNDFMFSTVMRKEKFCKRCWK